MTSIQERTTGSIWSWVAGLVAYGVMLCVAMLLYRPAEEILVAYDPILYVSGARGLATEGSYRIPELNGFPRITLYPPGQSVWLAPAWLGETDLATVFQRMLWSMWILGVISAGLGWSIAGQLGVPRLLGWLAGALVVMNSAWSYHACNFYSEPLFILLGLAAARLSMGNSESRGFQALRLVAIGLCLACAFLTRSAGLGIVAAALLWCIANRSLVALNRLLVVVPVLVAIVGWRAWTQGAGGYASIAGQVVREMGLIGWAQSTVGEFAACLGGYRFAEVVFGPIMVLADTAVQQRSWMRIGCEAVLMLLGVVFVAGTIRTLIRLGWSGFWLGLAVLGYVSQLALWPYRIGSRGFLPLTWVVLVGSVCAVGTLHDEAKRKLWSRLAAGCLAITLALNLAWITRTNLRATKAEGERKVELAEFVAVVKGTVPESESVGVGPLIPVTFVHKRLDRSLVGHPSEFFTVAWSKGIPPRFVLADRVEAHGPTAPGWIFSTLAKSANGRWLLLQREQAADSRSEQ